MFMLLLIHQNKQFPYHSLLPKKNWKKGKKDRLQTSQILIRRQQQTTESNNEKKVVKKLLSPLMKGKIVMLHDTSFFCKNSKKNSKKAAHIKME